MVKDSGDQGETKKNPRIKMMAGNILLDVICDFSLP
jgi:hypothetical protein